jgi:DNA (cytosine-5)-methyltransferase 1
MLAVDLFAGAGGSTVGAEAAGAKVILAANHWREAIAAHRANHPHAEHW